MNDAIGHFSRAVKLDTSFVEALLELGRVLIQAGRASDAVMPLETTVKLQPENPLTHFRLSNAYIRVGRKEEAQREMATYQDLSAKLQQNTDAIQKAIYGIQPGKPPQ